MKENDVGLACGTYWGERRRLKILVDNLKKRWGDLESVVLNCFCKPTVLICHAFHYYAQTNAGITPQHRPRIILSKYLTIPFQLSLFI
jgi:hypothetical protein